MRHVGLSALINNQYIPFLSRTTFYSVTMSVQEVRDQILSEYPRNDERCYLHIKLTFAVNTKFLYGPDRQFDVITTAVLGASMWHGAPQAILVEYNTEEGTFKTLFASRSRSTILEAYMDIHLQTNKWIYQKIDGQAGLGNEPIEGGELALEGQLEWNAAE